MIKKVTIPWELKYDFAIRAYTSIIKGYLYVIREKYGAAAALEIHESVLKLGDRAKNLTDAILKIFKIEGNDCETIGKWWDVWWELIGTEYTVPERSKSIDSVKITKCPFKTDYKDISDWPLPFVNIVVKAINPKAFTERPKGMCAGDPYCEYVTKIEE